MKKKISEMVLGLLVALLLVCPFVKAETEDDQAIADRLRKADEQKYHACLFEQTAPFERQQTFEELQNQAAGRDAFLLKDYLDRKRDGALCKVYSGSYIDSENHLVILLSDRSEACRKELEKLGFETDPVLQEGHGSYYETMDQLKKINEKITAINLAVLEERGSRDEQALMLFYPSANYEDRENLIELRLEVGQEKLGEAAGLFEKLVGRFSSVRFIPCEKGGNQAENCATTVYPGGGIAVSTYGDSHNVYLGLTAH